MKISKVFNSKVYFIFICFIVIIEFLFLLDGKEKIQELSNEIVSMRESKPIPFIHIDDNSGFISTTDTMASFEMFDGRSGQEYWVRVERYGFGKAHEFSVDTVQEAEMILRGLM